MVSTIAIVGCVGHLSIPKRYLFFYRPQTKFTKFIFLHLSVSNSVHMGGGCLQAHTQRGRLRGLAGRGVSRPTPRGKVEGSGRGVMYPSMHSADTPPHTCSRRLLLQAVCILLECILVCFLHTRCVTLNSDGSKECQCIMEFYIPKGLK